MIHNDQKHDFETVLLLEKYLIYKERQFGGFIDNVPRVKVSPYDPRSKEEILFGGNRGGDRMASLDNHHGYAAIYAKYLKPFLDNDAHVNIAEVGILMGSGLALWCELFPDSDVYGFDINLDYTKNNIPNLKNLGAFSKKEPILHELDQFLDNTQYLQKIFGNKKIDICIDDGFHSNETILKSFKSFLPFLAENFVYFIEDNAEVHKELINEYPELSIEAYGEMTVISRKIKENSVEKGARPLSIMFISHLSNLAGAERSLFDLATKFVKRGIECSVILHSDGPLKKLLNLNGVPVYIIPSSATWWCKNIEFIQDEDIKFLNIFENIKNDLLPLVQDLNPDVIYSQTIVKPIGSILAQMAGIPHIVSVREYGELDHQFSFRFGFQKSMKALYEDSDLIFCVTNDVRDAVFGKNAAKAITVYSSVSIDETKLDGCKIEYKPIDKNTVTKLCIPASVQESKGQLDAVRACKVLIDKGYNVELNLYGQSNAGYVEILQKFIDENNLIAYVKINGFNQNNLKLIYDADIILSCSVCEAFGRTMLEAALLKRPFIYSNSGGTKEVFIDGVHALAYEVGNYTQLAEKIAQTIDMNCEAGKRVEAAYEHVKQNFNDSRYVDTQVKAICDMVANREKKSVSACYELIDKNIDYKFLANYHMDEMINVQLFLSRDGNFCEDNSVIFDSINLRKQNHIILTIPQYLAANNHIRIDLGDRPQILSINGITLKDKNGHIAWKWFGNFSDFVETNQLQYIDGYGAVLCCGNDPYIILPALAENLQLLCIELEMKYFSPKEKADLIYQKINKDKSTIIQHQNKINDQKNVIDSQENELNSRNKIILQLNNTIESLNNEIISIKSTKGYRLLEIFRKVIRKLIPRGSKRRSIVKYTIYLPIKLVYKTVYSVYHFGITTTIKKISNESSSLIKQISNKCFSFFNNMKLRSFLREVTVANVKAFIHSVKNDGFKYTIRKAYQKLSSKNQNESFVFDVKNMYIDSAYVCDGIKYFDREYYYKLYPDVKLAGLDALGHYLNQGWKEGRKPSEHFSTLFYMSEYKNYLSENENPLIHYLRYGKKQGFCINFKTFEEGVFDSKLKTIRRKLNIRPHFHNYYTTIDLDKAVNSKNIAVHLHLYYEDMQCYFIEKLNNLKVNFTLFISVCEKTDINEVHKAFVNGLQHAVDVIVERVPNKGRDIAPFIITFGKRLLEFDYICHIHSKKSPHYDFQKNWKDEIIQNLLGSVSIVNQNLNLLVGDGKVVFNEPNAMIPLHHFGWSGNYNVAKELLQKYSNIDIEEYKATDFPQGSMLWAKAEVLKEFLSLPLNYNDFPEEPINPDGTIAHALERLLLIFAAKYTGFSYCIYKENSPTGFYRFEDKFDFSQYEKKHSNIKVLSYYLPQFDTNPINDKWHGKGFTEWTKVAAAQPLFYGHYQQHIPHKDIGYYHLTSPDVLAKQAKMMKESGVYGQIFYHYWFSGKLILEKPAQILLANKDIDMPFCFCWANENWTKKWDGNDAETILEQKYSQSDAKSFIGYLIPFFKDERYIKIDGRPVLYIYRVSSFPNFHEYKQAWEEECRKEGIAPLFLVATLIRGVASPHEYGMDAAVERAPYDWGEVSKSKIKDQIETYKENFCNVFDYEKIADHYSGIDYNIGYPVYKSLFTIWDNTARYGEKAYIVHNSTPARFQEWLHNLISYSKEKLPENQQFIIINAWNEWAEGAHLEPDEKFGYAYLNSIGRELFNVSNDIKTFSQGSDVIIDKNLNVGIFLSDNCNILLKDKSSVFSKSLKLSSIFNKCNVLINPEKTCDVTLRINRQAGDFGLHSMCLENILKMTLRNQCALLEIFNFSYNIKYISGETLAIENYWQGLPAISQEKDYYKINKVPSNAIVYDIDEAFKVILEKASHNNKLNRRVVIIIDHFLGGGTAFYVDSKIDEILSHSYVLRIQYSRYTGLYTATFYYNDKIVVTELSDISSIALIEHYFEIENIIINSLVYYDDIEKKVDFIKTLKKDHIKITYMLHDFYALCPQYNLLDSNGNFCNFRLTDDKKSCNDCISVLLKSNQVVVLVFDISKCTSINKWHKIFRRLLVDTVDNIIVFSESSFNIFTHAFPDAAHKTTVIPHKMEPLRKVKIAPHKSINIGIIGTIVFHKGSHIVSEIGDIILQDDLNAKVFVIGDFFDKNNGIHVTGKYERKNLPSIVEKLQIDIIFIPSISAETFSYTTSEAMSMGLPVACFNLGAQAEKVSKYEKGLIISQIDAQIALKEIIQFLENKSVKL